MCSSDLLASAVPQLAAAAQLISFVTWVGIGYALLRRWSRRHGERPIPPAAGSELAEVIAPFDREGEGRVRWQGQSWAARNLEPSRQLPSGSAVMVMGREGTRLQVLPRDSERVQD